MQSGRHADDEEGQYIEGDYGAAGSEGGLPEPLGEKARESGRYVKADFGDTGSTPAAPPSPRSAGIQRATTEQMAPWTRSANPAPIPEHSTSKHHPRRTALTIQGRHGICESDAVEAQAPDPERSRAAEGAAVVDAAQGVRGRTHDWLSRRTSLVIGSPLVGNLKYPSLLRTDARSR